jgi:putative ABC transport system permease protein
MTTPTSSPGREGWAPPIFRASLCLYPPTFRAELGPDMVETFNHRLADIRAGALRRGLFVLRECAGAGLGGLRLRFVAFAARGKDGGRTREPVGFQQPSPSRRFKDLLPEFGQDFRQALRSLWRRPGAAISGVMALGMGIGLTTMMSSIIISVAFRPLPVPGGDRIVHIEQDNPQRGEEGLMIQPHDLADWQAQQASFEELGGFYQASVNLSGSDRPERAFGAFVTTNTFEILQVPPRVGRGFLPEDGRVGAPPVVIISHGVWGARFGGRADVVGSQIRVNGEVSTIVGIMPEGFGFPYWQDVWVPVRVDLPALDRDQGPEMEVFGRRKAGVSLEQAISEFRGITDRLARSYPETNEGMRAVIEPYTLSYLEPEARPGLVAMFMTVFGVLLIACFNVANLLLALAVTRIKDLAIRVSVGATRRRIMVKVLQEAFLLAAMGAVLGVGLAYFGLEVIDRYIISTATFPPPFWMVFKLDPSILLFVVGITGVCALASGLLPALKASRTDVSSLLQENTRGGSGLKMGRLSRFMVTTELTVSATLLVVSGHLAMDVLGTQGAQYGYPIDDVLTARFGLFDELVPTREERQAIFDGLQTRLEARPEVVSAALAGTLPGVPIGRQGFMLMGQEYGEGEVLPQARTGRVSRGFFQAIDVPVLQGREFNREDDLDGPPVAVVNESFVTRFLADVEPLGAQLRFGDTGSEEPWLRVVGVVPDLNMDGAMNPQGNPEGVYLHLAQADYRFLNVMVRTRGDPLAFAPTLRDEVMALQQDTPIFFVQTLRDAININLLDLILLGGLFAAFAMAAFLMAAIGLYSVTAFLAGQRTRELGLRMALGARSGEVLSLVLRKGIHQILIGLVVGVSVAAGGRVLMEAGNGWAPPWNMTIVLVVSTALAATGLLAILVPAVRATQVNPVDALREE